MEQDGKEGPSHNAQLPSNASSKVRALLQESQLQDASHQARLKAIIEGFAINNMNIRNADTGQMLWEQSQWVDCFSKELEIHVPPDVLSCKAVAREMQFTSQHEISKFHLVQLVLLHGQPIEEWKFEFGFVIPGSTNTWQCIIEAAPSGQMLPAEVLSGNVVLETSFYDGDAFVCKSSLRVFYDAPRVGPPPS